MNRQQTIDELTSLANKAQKSSITRADALIDTIEQQGSFDRYSAHYKDAAATAAILGISRNTLKVLKEKAVAAGMPEPEFIGRRWQYSLEQVHFLLELAEKEPFYVRHPEAAAHVVAVQNQKGGVGKSNVSLNMAICLALNIKQRYRVLVLDLDPQGTQRMFLAPHIAHDEVDNILSAADIMQGNGTKELEESGENLRDIIHDHAILDTHIPNLKMISSFPTDAEFAVFGWEMALGDSGMDMTKLLKERLIDPIRDDFDIIIMDTGPHTDPMVWNAMYAANAVLVPCVPRAVDWHSTKYYLETLPNLFSQLPDDYAGMNWIKLLPTMVEGGNAKQSNIMSEIRYHLGSNVALNSISRNRAFETVAKDNMTVFDLLPSHYEGDNDTLNGAVKSVKAVADELESIMLESWPKKDEQHG